MKSVDQEVTTRNCKFLLSFNPKMTSKWEREIKNE